MNLKSCDFPFAEAICFLPPKFFYPTLGERASHFGRNVTFETKDMSTHLTLSVGRENLRLQKLSTGLDNFSPDKSLKKKESDCCPIDLVACPNFFTDVAA